MKELRIHSLIRCGNEGFCYSNQFSREYLSGKSRSEADGQDVRPQAAALKPLIYLMPLVGIAEAMPDTNCLIRSFLIKKSSRPTVPCDGPRMNPSVDVGCPPRPFRHLRMAERRTPDLSSSRAPVHSALVQKSVTAITNPAGRLSMWMLGNSGPLGKWKTIKSWQAACNQSNA